MMRNIIVILEVDDDRAIAEDLGTIEYLEREMARVAESGIFMGNARILDEDDKYDADAINMANRIFQEDAEEEIEGVNT